MKTVNQIREDFLEAYHMPDIEKAKSEMNRLLDEDFGWIDGSDFTSKHISPLRHFISSLNSENGMIYGMISEAFNKLMKECYSSEEKLNEN
jgi:hypothetical protein